MTPGKIPLRVKALKLVHVTTVPETLSFFRGQIAYMKERGFQVQAVSSPGKLLQEAAVREGIPVSAVNLPRRITPLADLAALFKLYKLFRRIRPEIVHAHTPKGGLLGVMAARLARVPVVVYGLRGLPYVTARGLRRLLLCWSETLACRLAHRVLANSFANRQSAITMGFCQGDKIFVLASGSSNGVDAKGRFNPQRISRGSRAETRRRYQIPPDALVMGYIGRIVRDKGIVELEEAWQLLREEFPSLYLILIGRLEPQDPVSPQVLERLKADPRVRFTGMVSDPALFYAAMDIFTLPTYREGFPNTPLEAAAMQLPVVATRIDGCTEAVADGVTGLLVPPGDAQALAAAIRQLLLDADQRRLIGEAGRRRVLESFRPEKIWQALYETYMELLSNNLGFSLTKT